ncbi:hypothetical protein PsorP6_006191 [Peronosclerospora sorghi]|uniref:Uncharacterized protein n=1 Tax=Peronosclerospora sorghi TaxID=230839 RepID=A0ACC0W3Y2_9STRA|nr:hypothetical protein PsorP6_006191 [Peronosclerospora sorghi]
MSLILRVREFCWNSIVNGQFENPDMQHAPIENKTVDFSPSSSPAGFNKSRSIHSLRQCRPDHSFKRSTWTLTKERKRLLLLPTHTVVNVVTNLAAPQLFLFIFRSLWLKLPPPPLHQVADWRMAARLARSNSEMEFRRTGVVKDSAHSRKMVS